MKASRETILRTYAGWTVLSALRQGPIRSRDGVYPLLDTINFDQIADNSLGAISKREFECWHKKALKKLVKDSRLNDQYGWAAKIINVYLKTYAFVADGGRRGLREWLHPPIDKGLWDGIEERFGNYPEIYDKTHCKTQIAHITTYEIYRTIIDGLQIAARKLECSLFEVEQLWKPHNNASK